MANSSSLLLKLAIPLVKAHGFTREALSLSVLHLPSTATRTQPLPDTAVSALFGQGDDARRILINAWQDHARQRMRTIISSEPGAQPTIRSVLRARLEYNEPVLAFLPEAFALLATPIPTPGIPLSLDVRPALKHIAEIANDACWITDKSDAATGTSWYARRASVAAIYAAAELHQLTSPHTAYLFLDSLLEASSAVKTSLDETELFATYIMKSCAGIVRSSGVF